jgi:hypothetical protein
MSTEDSPEVKVLTAKEALRQDLRDLEVPAGATVMLSPYEREFADYFVRVPVKSFDDLQTIGLVPRGLAEDKVRRAIAADDEEAYKIAQTILANYSARGGCECGEKTAARAPLNNLRQHYASTRKSFNPALARVVSEHLQTRVTWDSTVAGIVRNWTAFADRGFSAATTLNPSVLLAVSRDIIINRGATLQVEASTHSLLAGTIWIHQTGKLVHGGGYLKIWAAAISRYTNLITSVTAIEKIPWKLAKV